MFSCNYVELPHTHLPSGREDTVIIEGTRPNNKNSTVNNSTINNSTIQLCYNISVRLAKTTCYHCKKRLLLLAFNSRFGRGPRALRAYIHARKPACTIMMLYKCMNRHTHISPATRASPATGPTTCLAMPSEGKVVVPTAV